MSWLFSQALVEEYLGDTYLDGEPFAPLSGNNIQQAYCAPDKMTAFSSLSPFGMTFKPLTENLGEELLTLFREDFLAKTLVPQGKAQELTENEVECGEKWHGLLARFDLDSHLWRTVQCSLLEDLNESLQTLPQWGMTVGGELYLRPMLERHTKETVFGFSVPTPVASDATSGAVIGKNDTFYTTSTGMPRKVNQKGTDGSVGLARLVQMWPTPTSSTGGANHNSPSTLAGKRYTMNLAGAVQLNPVQQKWGTPKAQDSRHALRDRGKGNLGEQVSGLHNGGKLNPAWVEWLMGWPLGWTDLKPLEMDKCHSVPLPLGEFCVNE